MPLAIYILASATFAVGTQTYVFVGLLSDMSADLGVPVVVAGQLSTAFAITSAVTAPFAVNLVAGRERRRVLIIALLCIGSINLGMAMLSTFDALIAARILLAACSSLIIPMAGAIAASMVEPQRQGRALGIILSGLTLSLIFGVPMGSVIGGTFGWRSTFVFAGVVSLLAIPAVARFVPSSRGGQGPSLSNFKVLASPVVYVGLVLSAVSFVAAYPVFAFVGPLVETAAGISGSGIGFVQFLAGFGSIAGIVLGGRMADHGAFTRNTRQLFGTLVVVQATYSAWFLLPQMGTAWLALPVALSLFCTSAVLFALGPVIEKALVQAAPEHSALTLAMNTSVIYAGQGIGAALGGVVIGGQGFHSLGYLGGLIATVAFAIAMLTKVEPGTGQRP